MSSQEVNTFPALPKPHQSSGPALSQEPSPPATPPQLNAELSHAFKFIQRHYTTYWSADPYRQEDYIARAFPPEEQALRETIEIDSELRHFVERQISYKWDPPENKDKKGTLILRMITKLHVKVANGAASRIITELGRINVRRDGEDPIHAAAAAAVEEINFVGESGVNCGYRSSDDRVVHKVPDAAFDFGDQALKPTLVIEVGYTQDEEELYEKAAMFLKLSNGEVRTAIAIKIGSQSPHQRAQEEASIGSYVIHRWFNGQIEHKTYAVTTFRHKDGRVDDGNLQLRLSDFCPASVLPRSNDPKADPPLLIPHKLLNKFINAGQEAQRQKDLSENVVVITSPPSPTGVSYTYPNRNSAEVPRPMEHSRRTSDEWRHARNRGSSEAAVYEQADPASAISSHIRKQNINCADGTDSGIDDLDPDSPAPDAPLHKRPRRSSNASSI